MPLPCRIIPATHDIKSFFISQRSVIYITGFLYCGMEQLVARWIHTPEVTGSNPVPATTGELITASHGSHHLEKRIAQCGMQEGVKNKPWSVFSVGL